MAYERLTDAEEILAEEKRSRGTYIFVRRNDKLTVSLKNSAQQRPGVALVKKFLQDVFLPRGYPSSVSSDYMDYQIWDTVQAFVSTVNGTLTTHAILKGVGVGDQEATALAATVTWIMKDGTGMIGRIGFAWWKGYSLDTDCKKWRLVADITNDVAMCFELLLGSVIFKPYASLILCTSTGMKAIVGVAGGATRASITQHQAIRGNMGDVSAKDGSQETCVNLVASFLGVFILSHIEDKLWCLWILFCFNVFCHIFANYKAVRSLNILTLNGARFLLVVKHFLEYNIVCSPKVINQEENVFLGFGISDQVLTSRKISLGSSLKSIAEKDRSAVDVYSLKNLRRIYSSFPYVIFHNEQNIDVVLQENISDEDVIKAYFHALVLGAVLSEPLRLNKQSFNPHDDFHKLVEKCNLSELCDFYVIDFVLKKWEELSAALIRSESFEWITLMGDELESQVEEDEVLLAIYDGDPAFKRISATVFQYRCGDDGSPNSILLEISWPPTYPTEKPTINLDTFYNKHLDQYAKNFIKEKVDEKAEQYLGVAMTYTLIELVKDNVESWVTELSKHQPTKSVAKVEEQLTEDISAVHVTEPAAKKEPKKEQLSKAQKRRQWDRCDNRREKPRGWNWVDIVKHLSQSGPQTEFALSANS